MDCSESALDAKLSFSPLSDSNSPVVVHKRHAAGEESPAEDSEAGVDPVDHWVDSNCAVKLTKAIEEHVEAAHWDHHGPIVLDELHIGEHGVQSCLEEWH